MCPGLGAAISLVAQCVSELRADTYAVPARTTPSDPDVQDANSADHLCGHLGAEGLLARLQSGLGQQCVGYAEVVRRVLVEADQFVQGQPTQRRFRPFFGVTDGCD